MRVSTIRLRVLGLRARWSRRLSPRLTSRRTPSGACGSRANLQLRCARSLSKFERLGTSSPRRETALPAQHGRLQIDHDLQRARRDPDDEAVVEVSLIAPLSRDDGTVTLRRYPFNPTGRGCYSLASHTGGGLPSGQANVSTCPQWSHTT